MFSCKHCGEKFKNAISLTDHMRQRKDFMEGTDVENVNYSDVPKIVNATGDDVVSVLTESVVFVEGAAPKPPTIRPTRRGYECKACASRVAFFLQNPTELDVMLDNPDANTANAVRTKAWCLDHIIGAYRFCPFMTEHRVRLIGKTRGMSGVFQATTTASLHHGKHLTADELDECFGDISALFAIL